MRQVLALAEGLHDRRIVRVLTVLLASRTVEANVMGERCHRLKGGSVLPGSFAALFLSCPMRMVRINEAAKFQPVQLQVPLHEQGCVVW